MKQKITFLFWALMSLAFVGCSSDNEPESDSAGQEEYNLILGTITNPDGEIVFQSISGNPAERGMVVYGEAQSRQFCEMLLRTSWDGSNTTRTLSDGYGSLSVSGSEEDGVFHEINFNLKDYAPFTLKLATAEYFNGDNSSIAYGGFHGSKYWRCKSCGYFISAERGQPHPCPSCKKDYAGQWETVVSGNSPLF